MQDHALNPPKSTTIADLDDKTKLIDGTTLNDDSTVIDPMDQTAAAAKAANATNRFGRLVGIIGKTCHILITDCKSGAWHASIQHDKSPPFDFFKEWLATHGSFAPH